MVISTPYLWGYASWVSVTAIRPRLSLFELELRWWVTANRLERCERQYGRFGNKSWPWSSPGNCGGGICWTNVFRTGTKWQASAPMMRFNNSYFLFWSIDVWSCSSSPGQQSGQKLTLLLSTDKKPADANCAGGQMLQELNRENVGNNVDLKRRRRPRDACIW